MIIPHLPISFTLTEITNNFMNIAPLITTTIIAPHGMTDLVHADVNDKKKQLYKLNLICLLGSSFLCFCNQEDFLHLIFILSSAIHFRHDFPVESKPLKLLLSSLLVLNSESIGMPLFLMYMTFIHVPNHYRLNSKLISDNLRYSFLSIAGAMIILFTIGNNSPDLFYNENMFQLSKALIVSHIWYEEKYIHKDFEL